MTDPPTTDTAPSSNTGNLSIGRATSCPLYDLSLKASEVKPPSVLPGTQFHTPCMHAAAAGGVGGNAAILRADKRERCVASNKQRNSTTHYNATLKEITIASEPSLSRDVGKRMSLTLHDVILLGAILDSSASLSVVCYSNKWPVTG